MPIEGARITSRDFQTPGAPRHYRLGVFYVNPDDPSLLVDKRFGYGVDFNYGHPVGRVIGAFLALLMVGTIAGVGIMMVLNSLMTILNMAEAGKQIVEGLLIIVLLVVVYGRRKKN